VRSQPPKWARLMFLLISSFPLLPSRPSSLLFVGCPDAVVQHVARFVDYCLSFLILGFISEWLCNRRTQALYSTSTDAGDQRAACRRSMPPRCSGGRQECHWNCRGLIGGSSDPQASAVYSNIQYRTALYVQYIGKLVDLSRPFQLLGGITQTVLGKFI
jgi:hypothetical protein